MNVYTYYTHIMGFGNQDNILNAWGDSWRSNGWTPVILDPLTSGRHKRMAEFQLNKRHQLPTVNPNGYDLACWHRWFAFHTMGGGIMVDYDVINVGLRPDEVILGPPLILESCRVPCAVAADAKGAGEIVDAIMDHKPAPINGHWSDMYFFQATSWPHIHTCKEFGHDGWRTAKLIHFATGACRKAGLTKMEAIKRYT